MRLPWSLLGTAGMRRVHAAAVRARASCHARRSCQRPIWKRPASVPRNRQASTQTTARTSRSRTDKMETYAIMTASTGLKVLPADAPGVPGTRGFFPHRRPSDRPPFPSSGQTPSSTRQGHPSPARAARGRLPSRTNRGQSPLAFTEYPATSVGTPVE